MNERLKELAEQADIHGDSYLLYQHRLEKFAELIVQECGIALNPPVQNRNVISRGQAYDLIKRHFGIEEHRGWVCAKCGVDRTRDVCPLGHSAAITGQCPMTATAQGVTEQ